MKKNTIVIFDPEIIKGETKESINSMYPFKIGDHLLYMGEITNMRGHVIIADNKGKIFWGYHPENFRLPTDEEV